MYTAKEYQQLILNILEMKVRDLDKKSKKRKILWKKKLFPIIK